ncbi:hypothetical protein SETIT_4G234300v2 [Setaria italica]|uniref:Uncharacterized protein n=2 Tax=Setaria TaxID=4554 RepID=A0A368QXI1_SETIT|nr:hypothetical protein SETIT_4G234300v2 [Setaria italica]RCV22613.1 hypothetical protein SETIT_4G234300v2 [Setaria italica]TKW22720.1 hypothetical protein SEVIR_4G246400v2 [Setaria viridis]
MGSQALLDIVLGEGSPHQESSGRANITLLCRHPPVVHTQLSLDGSLSAKPLGQLPPEFLASDCYDSEVFVFEE